MSRDLNIPKGKYVFLLGGLIKNAGGMTRAMLKRLDFLVSKGIDVTVLLCARGMEQLVAVEHYRKLGYRNISENNFITTEQFWESL